MCITYLKSKIQAPIRHKKTRNAFLDPSTNGTCWWNYRLVQGRNFINKDRLDYLVKYITHLNPSANHCFFKINGNNKDQISVRMAFSHHRSGQGARLEDQFDRSRDPFPLPCVSESLEKCEKLFLLKGSFDVTSRMKTDPSQSSDQSQHPG